jgi:ClpP class serine protease
MHCGCTSYGGGVGDGLFGYNYKLRIMFNEQFLAIDEGWLAGYLNVLKMGVNQPNATNDKPMVRFEAAENSFSRGELSYYFDIKTELIKGKLVAIVPFQGAMASNWWGGVNTKWVAMQMKIAAENTNVISLVLDMNSPGGTVEGTATLGKVVKAIEKPVLTAVSMIGASAALIPAAHTTETWIASEKTTGMGSLGVMATYISLAKKMKAENYEVAVLRSKGSEDKALLNQMEELNPNALEEMQAVIDDMRVEMLSDIISGRPRISPDISGRMFWGREVIKAGFADYVGDLDAVVKRAAYLGMKG